MRNLNIRNKEILIIFVLINIFFLNLLFEYNKYLTFTKEEVFEVKAEVINIYQKQSDSILRLKASDFNFFTKIQKDKELKRFDYLNILIDSRNISFLQYLKGFYTTTLYFDRLSRDFTFKDKMIEKIESQHQNRKIAELFEAIFLATPISKELRKVFTSYGISHIVALSGFHLLVLSFIIYWLLFFPYSFFQKKYFPYRNRKFDISIITIFILFFYLLLTDIVPSLLRAFVLFCLGIYMLRSNIKILSYLNLLFTFLIVIALFPKYIFSLGLWFSIFAVFYIYLFIQYFKNYNKWFLLIFFNIWMFLIFNPVVHYYFPQTALEQFYSIPITIFFNIFYPFEIVLHILGFARYLDSYINLFLEYKFYVYEVFTPIYFYILYLFVSFISIYSKEAFIGLNILMIGFNLYMYLWV